MKIHHVGYLVDNMENAVNEFCTYGGQLAGDVVFDKERLVDIAFIKMGLVMIELVSPREESIAVGKSLRRLKKTPYHLCFECGKIDETIENMVHSGCVLVKEPQKAVALDNRRVAFLYSEGIGLFEILETERKEV